MVNSTNASLDLYSTEVTSDHLEDYMIYMSKYYLLVNRRQYAYSAIFLLVLQFIIILGGLIGNSLCIFTFWKIGLQDSVTLTFFTIAVADLITVLLYAIQWPMTVLVIITAESHFVHVPTVFGVYSGDLSYLVDACYSITLQVASYLIVYLAIQRCMCVMVPLHVRGMFTRRRACVLIACVWGLCLVTRVFRFAAIEFKPGWLVASNKTVLFLHSDNSIINVIDEKLFVIALGFLYPLCQVIILLCLIIIVYGLRKSANFRQKSTSAPVAASKDIVSSTRKTGSIDNSKDRKVVIQVAIVCSIFILSNLPVSIRQLCTYIFTPEIRNPEYLFFRLLYNDISVLTTTANASFNFIVYYKYNTKFRQFFLNLTHPPAKKT